MSKNVRKNYEDEDDGPLCLCEYYNKNNQRTHILFCCCNCEALDETCTYILCKRKGNSEKNLLVLFNEALDDILDRVRVPSFNGAVKVNSDLLISIITITLYILIGSINVLFSALTIILVPTLLYIRYFQLRFSNKPTATARNQIAYYITLVSLIMIYVLYNFYLKHELDDSYDAIHECLFLLVILLHVYLHFSNPGYLSSSKKEPAVEGAGGKYCKKCNIQKQDNNKISHCPLCMKCVYARDHHCFWIDNCVGYLNHKMFFFYLVSLFTFFIYSEFLIVSFFWKVWLSSNQSVAYCLFNDFYQNFSRSLLFLLFLQLISLTLYSFLILLQQILLISVNYTQYEMYKYSQTNRKFSLLMFLCGNFKLKACLKNFGRFLFQLRTKNNLVKNYCMNDRSIFV